MAAFLFLLRWPWNGAGCRSVSRYSWASATGWQRDICCQGRGLLRRGGGRGGEERSRLWCLLFHPDLESYSESSICKKNQLFGKEVVAAAKVLSLFHSLSQDSEESDWVLALSILGAPKPHSGGRQAKADAAGARRRGCRSRFCSSWYLCIQYEPS